jgi:hypothetical protein
VGDLEQERKNGPGMAMVEENTADSSMKSVGAVLVNPGVVLAAAGRAVSGGASVKGEGDCSMPAM